MKTNTFIFWASLLGLFLSSPFNGFSAINVSENFDGPEWPTVTGNPPSQNTASNFTVNSWSVTRGIGGTGGAATSSTNYFWLFRNTTNVPSSLTSPLLTNGIGSVTFAYRNSSAGAAFNILIKTFDGTSWTTNDVITTAAFTYTGYTNALNLTNAQQIMIERLDTASGQTAIDTLLITTAPPAVNLSNLTNSPALPTDQDPVAISANVSIQGLADTFAMTNYWREWPSTSWTNTMAMTSNAPGVYKSVSNIPPKAVGTLVEYYAQATYSSLGASTNTTSISNKSYLVRTKSSYTNLAVIGQLNASLSNGASYLWQGVIQVTNANPTFKFQGISNGVSVTWGDTNQAITSGPLSGQAEVTSTNITLSTTNNGYYLFTFNETNLQYSVLSCAYENFNTWTNADAYTPPHTNSANWILFSANTSNDPSRLYSGTGRSAIVETNGWIQTPYLSNGVGQISFWYRNWPTNGAPTGKFQIQTSSNSTNWSAPASLTISNIVSTNFLFFSTTTNDYGSKYVRIQNTQTAATARLCFDEIVIAQAGAGVSGVSATPTTATILDPVTIAIDLTPYNGAMITNVTAWYRFDTNSAWSTAPMISTNGTRYMLTNSLIGLPVGTLYYAIQCEFSGFQAISPLFSPSTNAAATVTITLPSDSRYEPFDAPQWPTVTGNPPSQNTASNFTANSWTVTRGIGGTGGAATSSTNYFWLFRNTTNMPSSLTSPLLTNGIGSVTFAYRNTSAGAAFNILIKTFDGTSWTTNDVITTAAFTYTGYTNALNLANAQQIMIERLDTASGQTAIDTLHITYPPANVLVTNVNINPGYPVAGQAFTASCDVVSLNSIFPAYNISPQLYYWTSGALNSNTMTRSWISGTTNHYTIIQSLSNVTRDTFLNYYVRADFDGYYGSLPEKKSPRFSITNSILVRASASPYQTVGVSVNGSLTTGRMLTSGIWQAVFTTASTNSLAFTINGLGYGSSTMDSTNTIQWGNSSNYQTQLPLYDYGRTNNAEISLTNGNFNGQYVVRFNENTGEYFLQKCLYQDFDANGFDTADKYVQKGLNSLSAGSGIKLNLWSTDTARKRVEDFSTGNWSLATNGPAAYGGGSYSYYSWYNSYTNLSAVPHMRSPDAIIKPSDAYIAQGSHWEPFPSLNGIGTVIVKFKPLSTNMPQRMQIYGIATNFINNVNDFSDSDLWGSPLAQTNSVSNTTQYCYWTNVFNTNTTLALVFAPTSQTAVASIEVNDWFASEATNEGWIAHQSWIEVDPTNQPNNRCRFETSRAKAGSVQGLDSPAIAGGVSIISFSYSGLNSNPVSFILQACLTNPVNWSNSTNLLIQTNVVFGSPGITYSNATYPFMSSAPIIYLRLLNTTPAPGALLLRTFTADGFTTTNDWYVNNANIDYMPAITNLPRRFFGGACYLNSNYVADVSIGITNRPNSNIFTCVKSPALAEGIGEVSFWYRNWTTNPITPPTTLLVQTSVSGADASENWTTISTIPNISNLSDYVYFKTDLYDATSKYVRVCNVIPSSNNSDRICLDDLTITAPWASRLSLSNLTMIPSIPLADDPVTLSVDVYNLLYSPTNIEVYGYYATGTTYSAMTSSAPTLLSMSCISTTATWTGPKFRYQTPTPSRIPALPADTFVRFGALAIFSGYHTEASSPTTNQQSRMAPTWYYPLNTLYGSNSSYYVVFSCPTGSVWINEINIDDWTYYAENQYIELCGTAGSVISNWSIEVRSSATATQGYYRITTTPYLSTGTNGFGFWVLGTTAISQRNQTLTNELPSPTGGISLTRPSGIFVDAISYSAGLSGNIIDAALTNQGFRYSGLDNANYNSSLGISGTNYVRTSWVQAAEGQFSPGSANPWQYFILGSTNSPTVTIYRFNITSSNSTIECTKTDNWLPTPWYSTNLLSTSLWTSVAGYTLTSNATNYVLYIPTLTNRNPVFYKIVSTNSP